MPDMLVGCTAIEYHLALHSLAETLAYAVALQDVQSAAETSPAVDSEAETIRPPCLDMNS